MKFRTITSVFIIGMLFTLVGCAQTQEGSPEERIEDVGFDTRIYGAWNRTATYTDGANMGSASASTIFTEDGRYISVGTCTVNGAYIVIDDLITMTIDSSDCPGYSGPYEYNSTFRMSEDGEKLTIDTESIGHLVTETFERATE